MRLSRFAPLLALAVAAACADLKDLATLSRDLQAQYHLPVNVNLNRGSNGAHLTVTFAAAPQAALKLDSAGRAEFARDVAAFAKSHYPRAGQLQDIRVAFTTVSGGGPLTITRTDARYAFGVRDLP